MSASRGLRLYLLALAAVTVLLAPADAAHAQRPPVIDVHVHSGEPQARMVAQYDSLNVRFAIVTGLQTELPEWADADTSRFAFGLLFPCDQGMMPANGIPCFNDGTDYPDTTWLRAELQSGRIRVLGELTPQYVGMSPNDPRMEPYWRLAEELDVPVAIHMGLGPPFAAYDVTPAPYKSPQFRMTAGDPLLLEEVLLRHKRLRVNVMHAGWPYLESMIALLHAHPNVSVDLGVLQLLPRASFLRHLRGLVEAEDGFSDRIMFGSDFSDFQAQGIDLIREADFLSAEQKADILCNNAARFYRLRPGICDP